MKQLFLLALLLAAIPARASHVVTDETGRVVTLPDHPQRIISLVPSITDDLYALGAGDEVVAISDYVEYPADARKKPTVGSIMTPSIETILSLHPDLILGMPRVNQQTVLDQLERLGIPVFLVDPHGIDGILHTLTILGQAIHREPQATVLVTNLGRRIAAVRASVGGKPPVSVLWPISYDPVIAPGKGSFVTEIIEAAGGRSITGDIPEEWPHVSMEVIIARAPQALLLVRGGHTTLDVLKSRPGWSTLPAVKAQRVYFVDGRINFPSPVAIDLLEDLAKEFHP